MVREPKDSTLWIKGNKNVKKTVYNVKWIVLIWHFSSLLDHSMRFYTRSHSHQFTHIHTIYSMYESIVLRATRYFFPIIHIPTLINAI